MLVRRLRPTASSSCTQYVQAHVVGGRCAAEWRSSLRPLGVRVQSGAACVPLLEGVVLFATHYLLEERWHRTSARLEWTWNLQSSIPFTPMALSQALRFLREDEERRRVLSDLCDVSGPVAVISAIFPVLVESMALPGGVR